MKDLFYPQRVHMQIDVETNVSVEVRVTSSGTTKLGHLAQPRSVREGLKEKMTCVCVLKINRSPQADGHGGKHFSWQEHI